MFGDERLACEVKFHTKLTPSKVACRDYVRGIISMPKKICTLSNFRFNLPIVQEWDKIEASNLYPRYKARHCIIKQL